MFCETYDKLLTFFYIFARFAIFVKIATFEGAPFNISLEVSPNPWRIFAEFDIFVKIITFQGATFRQPAAAIFRQICHFGQICHFCEIRHFRRIRQFTEGHLLTFPPILWQKFSIFAFFATLKIFLKFAFFVKFATFQEAPYNILIETSPKLLPLLVPTILIILLK